MDRSQVEDGPETPAHVFALRALKTAFFGTPAPPIQNSQTVQTKNGKQTEPQFDSVRESALPRPSKSSSTNVTSPAKSILVTPGTTTGVTRRKTVSFSGLRNEVKIGSDNKADKQHVETTNPNEPQETDDGSTPRRTLFRTQSEPTPQGTPYSYALNQKDLPKPDQEGRDSLDPFKVTPSQDETIDLGAPKSRSGQHWKQEYQKEHDKSKTEMQKLIRYSQIAKSYATKRDDEAVRMREKLFDAEAKVEEMENRISELAGELARAKEQDGVQAELLDELAKQTAQVLRFKQKAEKYQAALEQNERLQPNHLRSSDLSAREELERRAATLEEENERLQKTVTRVKEEVRRSEERHKIGMQERRRKEEKAHARKKSLQEQLHKVKMENKRLATELTRAKALQGQLDANPLSGHASMKVTNPIGGNVKQGGAKQRVAPASSRQLTAQLDQQRRLQALPNGYDPAQQQYNSTRGADASLATNEPSKWRQKRPKPSSAPAPEQDDTLDLFNLPTKRSKDSFHFELYSDQALPRKTSSTRHLSYSSPGDGVGQEALTKRQSTSRSENIQTKRTNANRSLSERVLAARQDPVLSQGQKETLRAQEAIKENIRTEVLA